MLCLLLFHGAEILGFMAGMGLGLVAFLAFSIWLFSRFRGKLIIPVLGYVLLAALGCFWFVYIDGINSETLPDVGFFIAVPWAFCFPWILLFFILSGMGLVPDYLDPYVFPISIGLNAAWFYLIGWTGKRRANV